jgi:hypothetical protein
MKKVIFAILCILSFSPTVHAVYTAPIGIPAPTWGIDETVPARPSPWTAATPGYYFVDKNAYLGTACTNTSNPYGYPGHPRCDPPRPLTAGSRVEIAGTYNPIDYVVGTFYTTATETPTGDTWAVGTDSGTAPNYTGSRTGNAGPSWIVPYDSNTVLTSTGSKMGVHGSYIYFDGFAADGVTRNMTSYQKILQIGSASTAINWSSDHVMVRGMNITGDGVLTASGVSTQGSTTTTIANVLIYNNAFADWGNMAATTDLDPTAIILGQYLSSIWILDNSITNIANTTIALTGANSSASDTAPRLRFVYVGRNNITASKVSGIAIKNAQDVIISENTIYDIRDSSWSDGKCFGAQYDPERVWWLYNTCHKALLGLRVSSGNGGVTGAYLYAIGNVFYDINHDYHCTQEVTNCTSKETLDESEFHGAAISVWWANKFYAVNNTIYDASQGITMPHSSYNSDEVVIENNIVSTLNDDVGHLVWVVRNTPTSGNFVVRNNILYNAGRTWRSRWQTTDYTTLSSFESDVHTAYENVTISGGINSDPSFLDAANGSLAVSAGDAPPVGAGIAAASLSVDVYALFQSTYGLSIANDRSLLARPQNTTWDIGAYEWGAGGSDATAPDVHISTQAQTVHANAVSIAASASDGIGVTSCKFRIGSAPDGSNGTACTGTDRVTCAVTGLTGGGSTTVYVGCGDAAGNWGSDSVAIGYYPAIIGDFGTGGTIGNFGTGGTIGDLY